MLIITLLSACDFSIFNWDLPKFAMVETLVPDQVLNVSAHCGGNVYDDGGSTVQERGICYGVNTNPTVGNNKVISGNGLGNFDANIGNLKASTTYYIRAYAITKVGTSYGNEVVFTTAGLATITTNPASSITPTTAVVGGNVTNSGGLTVTQRGICYSTTSNPTTSNNKVLSGSGTGAYSVTLTGLSSNTTFYARAYAINSIGTAYANEINFKTSSPLLIGQSYQGGIIFYIDGTLSHGLVCATADQASGISWGCLGMSIGTSTSIGTGLANTIAIVSNCPTTTTAARICYDLVLNGYSDWYMPSYYELNLMYSNLKAFGLGNFSNTYYWTSSQMSSNNSYLQYFGNGGMYNTSKGSTYNVRAIRSF